MNAPPLQQVKRPIGIKIQQIVRNPDGVTLTDSTVEVHGNNLKSCERLARKIFKEDLK